MTKIKVTKMQGCGNDFVVIDYSEYEKSGLDMSELAKKACDRHFGLGADGMIIPKLDSEDTDIAWYFYNSDGTTAQMCGNGMRCFAKYVYDKKLIDKKKFSVKTGAGIISPEILEDGNVKVNMSSPILEPKKIPFIGSKNLNQKIKVLDKEFIINAVSMGNPHCVIFTEGDVYEMAKTYGPELEKHEMYPEKTNVEFVKIKSRNEVDFCVYERGCGITLACGTGACASVVAGVLNNLTDCKVKVNLLGGAVTVDWSEHADNKSENIYLIGPAEYSYFAEYLL
ncbi:TPA: diaminopimelate epimerase [Candidatus Gastranaerophilales bacterium HUM_9]|nr:MAG TPA: diaminopimelate epimerase [Candidatus Gastranaerophilales bacterium HUM_9]HBX34236.1 diaminopimelate epimerase [Cyanobacteria bacterium UBA11440]